MFSLKSLLAAGLAFWSAVSVNAAPMADARAVVRAVNASSTVCGVEPAPGIRKPANGSTITITADEQQNYAGHSFKVVYCSGQYFKTSSVNTSTWLAPAGPSYDPSAYSAQALALGTPPSPNAAAAGYYGYEYEVTVNPQNGNYPKGHQVLTVYEIETGYYNPYNIETHSVTLNFVLQTYGSSSG